MTDWMSIMAWTLVAELEREVALVRAELDVATFTAAWAEGQAMDVDQAVALALED